MVTLTIELIDSLRTSRGGYTDATLKHFGLSNTTFKSGWRYRLVGHQMTEAEFAEAQAGSLIKASVARKMAREKAEASRLDAIKASPQSGDTSLLGAGLLFLSRHGVNPCGFGYARLASAVAFVSTGAKRRFSDKRNAKNYLRECRASGVLDAKFDYRFERPEFSEVRAVKSTEPTRPARPALDPSYTRNKYLAMLDSQAWRELRIAVLLHYGRKCCLCGDGDEVIQVDHIIPASVDWSRRMDFTNLQVLCKPCNLGKGNRYTEDWRR